MTAHLQQLHIKVSCGGSAPAAASPVAVTASRNTFELTRRMLNAAPLAGAMVEAWA